MQEQRYDFYDQAVNRLRGLQSRQAVDIKHGEAVDQDQAPIAAISREAGSFGESECPVFDAPLHYPLATQLLRSEA